MAIAGSGQEPIRYVGGVSIDPAPHDGRLRPAVGVANYQTFRANRSHPEQAEGYGWTYNHAPMLAHWQGRFWQEYLSNPVDEHRPPGHTLLLSSPDGRTWGQPQVLFPAYEPPAGTALPEGATGYMMHQRMGFYTAPDGRLLALGFYGHSEDPFGPGGIGRVVREVHPDGSVGPIYFIRYSSHAGWNEGNTSYPLYTHSPDPGFVAACEALLADRLRRLQWWDEDRGLDGFYGGVKEAGSALSFYHRADGQVVALWKWARAALSADEGATFIPPVRLPTITIDGAKMWGQRTPDGRYALVYNPTTYSEHRYPLAVITGDDGIIFDDLLVVHAEVPPRRFFGRYKDYGPQYVRGIAEGNGAPPDGGMWITYSMNKEDMWVTRIPVPVRGTVEGPVADDFDGCPPGGHVPDWNVYSPLWAPVSVVDTAAGGALELRDEDPYDYAKAVRVFPEGRQAAVSLLVHAGQAGPGMLDLEVLDRFGNRPVRLRFGEDGMARATAGNDVVELQPYRPGAWHQVEIAVEAAPFGHYSVRIDGRPALEGAPLAEAALSVERLCLRTGPYRDEPTRQTDNEAPHDPLPGGDERAPAAVFHVRQVRAESR